MRWTTQLHYTTTVYSIWYSITITIITCTSLLFLVALSKSLLTVPASPRPNLTQLHHHNFVYYKRYTHIPLNVHVSWVSEGEVLTVASTCQGFVWGGHSLPLDQILPPLGDTCSYNQPLNPCLNNFSRNELLPEPFNENQRNMRIRVQQRAMTQ